MAILEYMKNNRSLCELLSDIPNEELNNVEIRIFEPGELLIKSGTYPDKMYIVIDGICNVLRDLDNGNIYNVYQIKGADIIGVSEILSGRDKYVASIEAKVKTTVGIVKRETFLKWIDEYKGVSIKILLRISDRLHRTVALLTEYTNNPSYYSLVSFLINSCTFYKGVNKSDINPIRIYETRQEIAEKVGVNIRTVNRVIKDLKEKSLVSINKGKIFIDNKQLDKLEEIKANFHF